MAEENTTNWWEDPAYQNLAIQFIQQYQNSATGDAASSAANNSLAAVQGALASVGQYAPTAMDFSAYMPLLNVIGSKDYSKGAAVADSQGFIDKIFRDYEQKTLPKLYSNPRASGIYNDSTTQLLADNAYGAAVAEGQANLVQNILSYSQARESQLKPVLELLNAQTSNNNAFMGANVGFANGILGATGALLGAQNAVGAVNTANTAQNNQDNLATLGNLLQAGATAYNQYNTNNANNASQSSGETGTINNSSMNTMGDEYDTEDWYRA
jgi:hypothetical protein